MLLLWIILPILLVFATAAILSTVLLTNTPPTLATCEVDPTTLPDVSSSRFQQCYTLDGQYPTATWYDTENDWVVISPGSANLALLPGAESICINFCPAVDLPLTCVQPNEIYENCLDVLTPQGCTSSTNPVAANGTTLLYVIQAGSYACFPPLT